MSESKAELMVLALLMHWRHLERLVFDQSRRHWNASRRGTSVEGKRLLLLGSGTCAESCDRIARAFNIAVTQLTPDQLRRLCNHKNRHNNTLLTSFADADAIVLGDSEGVFLDSELSCDLLSRAKPGVVIVSLARHPSIDQGALVERLRSNFVGLFAADEDGLSQFDDPGIFTDLENVVVPSSMVRLKAR